MQEFFLPKTDTEIPTVQEYGGIKWMIHINHLLPLVAWYTEYPSTALTLNSSMGTVSNSNVHF